MSVFPKLTAIGGVKLLLLLTALHTLFTWEEGEGLGSPSAFYHSKISWHRLAQQILKLGKINHLYYLAARMNSWYPAERSVGSWNPAHIWSSSYGPCPRIHSKKKAPHSNWHKDTRSAAGHPMHSKIYKWVEGSNSAFILLNTPCVPKHIALPRHLLEQVSNQFMTPFNFN